MGFTLVELLIVLVILGILAGIVIPRMNSERTEATVSALKANVSLVSMTLEFHRQKTEDGSWPPTVDASWFSSRKYPIHPDKPDGVPKIEVVNQPALLHPSQKVLGSGSAGAFWYNAANGMFRARVADQGSNAETLDIYNQINGSSSADLGTPSASGGGGGGVALPVPD